MEITASAITLNVDDPSASAEFAKRYFGFQEEMAADGFVSLAHPNAGFPSRRASDVQAAHARRTPRRRTSRRVRRRGRRSRARQVARPGD